MVFLRPTILRNNSDVTAISNRKYERQRRMGIALTKAQGLESDYLENRPRTLDELYDGIPMDSEDGVTIGMITNEVPEDEKEE